MGDPRGNGRSSIARHCSRISDILGDDQPGDDRPGLKADELAAHSRRGLRIPGFLDFEPPNRWVPRPPSPISLWRLRWDEPKTSLDCHGGCGLRSVLLQHGKDSVANPAFWVFAVTSVVVALSVMTGLIIGVAPLIERTTRKDGMRTAADSPLQTPLDRTPSTPGGDNFAVAGPP